MEHPPLGRPAINPTLSNQKNHGKQTCYFKPVNDILWQAGPRIDHIRAMSKAPEKFLRIFRLWLLATMWPTFTSPKGIDALITPYCYDGPLPTDGWPPEAGEQPWDTYPDIQSLCTYIHEFPGPSMHCLCASTNAPTRLTCRPPLRWLDTSHEGTNRLQRFCEEACECYDSDSSSDEEEHSENEDSQPSRHRLHNGYAFHLTPRVRNRLSTEFDILQESGFFMSEKTPANSDPTCLATSTCSGSADCNGIREIEGCEGAVCLLREQSGHFLRLGGCGIVESTMGRSRTSSSFFGMRKRSADAPLCACNSSWISQSCCGSPNGIVWEDPALKVGGIYIR